MTAQEYDVLLVGAGFGAIAMLHRLRKLGIKCRIYEKGARSGGVWYWNCYPGARVDSDAPIYQLFDSEVWQDYNFKERYPGWKELQDYFDYLDKKLDLSKDIEYNVEVTGGRFNESTHKWTVKTAQGHETTCRWFVPCIGFAAKEQYPNYPGLDKFKGTIHHTAKWPQGGVDLKNKRIAVVGTGASGVQTIQECGPEAKHLTVYQRTPNLCCPMNQHPLDEDDNMRLKKEGKFDEAFGMLKGTFAGFAYDFNEKKTFDDTPEEREKFYRNLLIEQGGFRYWLNTYSDMLFDDKANDEAYNFWRDFVRSRINDPVKKEKLAPMKKPHPWGTKRPSLEQSYYEVYNYPHVDLIDIGEEPIEEFTETGIRTKSGLVEVDVVALATGFDAVTGSLTMLDIRGTDDRTIKEHWKEGLRTSIGVAMNKFPNMFFLYGPQAPTAFSNGPSCVQFQAEWLSRTLGECKEQGVTRMEAKQDAVDDWCKRTQEAWDITLFPQAKSWYQGANIPGRKVEPLNWAGGMPAYIKALDDSTDKGFSGWTIASAA